MPSPMYKFLVTQASGHNFNAMGICLSGGNIVLTPNLSKPTQSYQGELHFQAIPGWLYTLTSCKSQR